LHTYFVYESRSRPLQEGGAWAGENRRSPSEI